MTKWIDGDHSDLKDEQELLLAIEEIKKLHASQKPKHTFGFDVYDHLLDKLSKDEKESFINIGRKLSILPFVTIHGDINKDNILISNNKAYLIDVEWVSQGPAIIDYAYLISFTSANINLVSKYSGIGHTELKDAISYIKTHTKLWCINENTPKSLSLLNSL